MPIGKLRIKKKAPCMMKASDNALEMIKSFEGFSAVPYCCPAGCLTIGYGYTHGVTRDMRLTPEQADAQLREFVCKLDTSVAAVVKVPLNQNQWDALIVLAYNAKWGEFVTSHLLAELNRMNFAKALVYWRSWCHAIVKGKKVELPGLVKRREAEIALFNTPMEAAQEYAGTLPPQSAAGELMERVGGSQQTTGIAISFGGLISWAYTKITGKDFPL